MITWEHKEKGEAVPPRHEGIWWGEV